MPQLQALHGQRVCSELKLICKHTSGVKKPLEVSCSIYTNASDIMACQERKEKSSVRMKVPNHFWRSFICKATINDLLPKKDAGSPSGPTMGVSVNDGVT